MSKKQHSHLLLTVFFVLLLIFCLFCFSFFLHIGVNLPNSVKKILWFGIRPRVQRVSIVESVKKLTPHRKT